MQKFLLGITCLMLLGMAQVFSQTQGASQVSTSFFGADQFDFEPSEVKTPAPKGTYPEKPKPPTQPMGCDSPAIAYVRVNIKWMLRSDGTGNFTEDGDGGVAPGGNINGYNRAEMLIERMNRHWRTNAQMAQPPGNTTPVLDTRIRFVLSSVCFIRDDDYYGSGAQNGDLDWSMVAEYGTNVWEEINIFMVESGGNFGTSGRANQLGSTNLTIPLATKIYDEWSGAYRHPIVNNQNHAAQPYYNGGNDGVLHGGTINSRVISHEIGHLLSLRHLSTSSSDGCDDTPMINGCWSCNDRTNLMYNPGRMIPYAFTPCQIDRMHNILSWDASSYVQKCGDCLPANAFFKMPDLVCLDNHDQIILDGRASFNEAKYTIWISRVNNVGDWQAIPGTEWQMPWTSGEVGTVNIESIYPFAGNMANGHVYRVLLAVQNYDDEGKFCTGWDQYVRWVTTYYCAVAPPGGKKRMANGGGNLFRFSPNPATEVVTLSYDLASFQQAEVTIFDLSGRELLQQRLDVNAQQARLGLAELPRGTYLLRLRADGQAIAHEKLIISQ